MLSFADNEGQVLSVMFALFLGLLICFAQRRTFEISNSRAIAIYVWHTLFSMFYMYYSMNNTADATLYYLTSLNYVDGFDFGTKGIYFFTSFLLVLILQ